MIKRGKKKIPSHYGMKDYYKHYDQNNEYKVSKSIYNKVVGEFNKLVITEMLDNNQEYSLPELGLRLTIRKDKRTPKIVNGKVVNTSPVDWVTTNKLWENDNEAKKNKILVRFLNNHTLGYVFRIYCKKFETKLKNKSVYKFKPSRFFQRSLSKRIKDLTKDKFESYLLYKQ